PLQEVDRQETRQIEGEKCGGIDLPAHLGLRADAAETVDEALQPAERPIEAKRPAFVHAGHVGAQRLREPDENDEIEHELKRAVRSHEKSSGLRSARTR